MYIKANNNATSRLKNPLLTIFSLFIYSIIDIIQPYLSNVSGKKSLMSVGKNNISITQNTNSTHEKYIINIFFLFENQEDKNNSSTGIPILRTHSDSPKCFVPNVVS